MPPKSAKQTNKQNTNRTKQMKALQYIQKFNNLADTQEAFQSMTMQEGFLGGRVYQNILNPPPRGFFILNIFLTP